MAQMLAGDFSSSTPAASSSEPARAPATHGQVLACGGCPTIRDTVLRPYIKVSRRIMASTLGSLCSGI